MNAANAKGRGHAHRGRPGDSIHAKTAAANSMVKNITPSQASHSRPMEAPSNGARAHATGGGYTYRPSP